MSTSVDTTEGGCASEQWPAPVSQPMPEPRRAPLFVAAFLAVLAVLVGAAAMAVRGGEHPATQPHF